MAVKIGRLGFIAVGTEATPGVPVIPAAYIPFLECSLTEKIDVLADVSARGTRDAQPENSQQGRQWGEGNLRVNLDATLAPYLIYGAFGTLNTATEGGGVFTHTFTAGTTNTPKSLSVIFDRSGQDRLLFPYSVISSLDIAYSDRFAEVNASIMSQFPSTSVSGTLTTTSGFYYAFRHATVQVGSDIIAAGNSATPLKIRSFQVTLNNNSESQFVSGNRNPDSIIHKALEIKGSFRVAFEDTTQRNNFYNLTKQAMIITFVGNGIGNNMTEFVKLRFYKIRIDDAPVETPNDDYVSQEIAFTAEYASGNSAAMDVQVRNRTSTY